MTTEPLPGVYARLARKVVAQTVECLHDAGLESRIQRLLATCGKCNNTGRAPDPKYAALQEALWEPCMCGICMEQNKGTKRHPADCDCRGTGQSDFPRPLDELDAGELAEAMRCIGTPVACEIREHDAAAWFGNEGEAYYYHLCPTLLEALIRAADAAMEEKPCIASNVS